MAKVIAIIVVMVSFHSAANAAFLVVNQQGELVGANNVNVLGNLYNVTFDDRSCNELFDGCDPSKFVFVGLENSQAAGQALLDQVFLDTMQGAFDTSPNLTVGCESLVVCTVLIPFQFPNVTGGVISSEVDNFSNSSFGVDSVVRFQNGNKFAGRILSATTAPSINTRFTFAVFTQPTNTEPQKVSNASTIVFLLTGLLVLTIAQRRKLYK
ncbi:MAG: hypothetical protein AAGC95_02630 [Pseudomonadota bacterium]